MINYTTAGCTHPDVIFTVGNEKRICPTKGEAGLGRMISGGRPYSTEKPWVVGLASETPVTALAGSRPSSVSLSAKWGVIWG